MTPLYTTAQIRAIEAAAHLSLMQRAAEAVIAFLAQHDFHRFLVIAGPGNNGGDALTVATLLQQQGKTVFVWQPLGAARSEEAKNAAALFLA